MIQALARIVRGTHERIRRSPGSAIHLTWVKRSGWLAAHLGETVILAPRFPHEAAIERRATQTDSLGEFSVHESYELAESRRNSDAVRTPKALGRFYRWLVVQRRPEVVLEFGTAFGISGMYWLAGIEENGFGNLFTFEIQEEWRQIAVANLSSIGTRFTSIAGAFEDKVEETLQERKIDLAFIDAIHTRAWVLPQFEQVMKRMRPGGLVAFDDIHFSEDMRETWKIIASDPRGVASVGLGGHVGLFEVNSSPSSIIPTNLGVQK
jgi:predicted O-methyltransferase YrrM